MTSSRFMRMQAAQKEVECVTRLYRLVIIIVCCLESYGEKLDVLEIVVGVFGKFAQVMTGKLLQCHRIQLKNSFSSYIAKVIIFCIDGPSECSRSKQLNNLPPWRRENIFRVCCCTIGGGKWFLWQFFLQKKKHDSKQSQEHDTWYMSSLWSKIYHLLWSTKRRIFRSANNIL